MKLKGLLKGLCILGLTLLPISFSSAAVYTGSIPGIIYNTSMPNYPFTYKIDNVLNLTTNSDLRNFFYTADCSITSDCRGARSWILFWSNSKLAGYGNVNTDSTHRVIVQGYYNSYCSSTLSNYASYCYPGVNNAGNYTTSIDNFYNLGAVYDSYYFNNDQLVRPYLCFLSNSKNLASCFTINVGNNSTDYNGYISGSYILTSNGNNLTDFSSESYKFGLSPFRFVGVNDDLPQSDVIEIWEGTTGTNKEYMSGFENRGYYKGLCYSQFYTGSLVDSNTQMYEMFQGDLDDSTYYGASVFDLYRSEGSTLSTHSWFQMRYNLMKYTYERNDLTPFVGYEKGTWNLMFNVYNNHFNDNFSIIDYFTYCKMKVDGYCENCVFTGDVSSGMSDYIVREREKGSYIFSGVDFTGSASFLSLFNDLYTRAKQIFLVDESQSSIVGILPTYIIFGFFLFLLLYGLRR